MVITNEANESVAAMHRSAIEFFAKCIHSYLECDDEVQAMIREMSEIISDANATDDEREMAAGTISEALFPSYDKGSLGISIEEVEKACCDNEPDGQAAREHLDAQERQFAERLGHWLDKKGMSQSDLASRVGVGASAISMMLKRECRPQRRTVRKIAEALDVAPQELWPEY
jgi:lambda repressor-like predicted transcriptional regulator